jgi:Bacterial dnaA protein helix-turn-helix/NADPH-dependent FMN reductase
MTMLKIASSEIAAPDLAPEGGGAAEAVPARLQAHAVADEAQWHRSDDVRLCATDQLIKAAHYRVSAKDIRRRCRRAPITRARRNAFLLCRELAGRSFPEIGRRLGDFDHTMVLHGFSKTLAHQSYAVIDESSGGSLRIEAADRLLSMIDADTVVVPGHGAVTDRGGLIAFHNMLRSIEDKILAMIEARRGLPEIIAARPTAEFDPLWGRGYVTGARFTRMVPAGDETLHNAGSHDMVRIRAFGGSSRRDSLNQRLLDQAALGAHAAGAEVTSIRLSDFELPIDDADWEAEHGLPNGAEALKALFAGQRLYGAAQERPGLDESSQWVRCRQGPASRARTHVSAERPRFDLPKGCGLRTAAAFFAASRSDDMQ